MDEGKYDIGMVGLGVMGSNLALNMAGHGYRVVGLDSNAEKAAAFQANDQQGNISGTTQPQEFVKGLKKPRAIMLLVPAGQPVDAVIEELLPLLSSDDMIIDGGNSYYKDTNCRQKDLADRNILFLGVGISGGEAGARFGPSIMPGGPLQGYQRVQPIFEAVAAKVNGEPCVAYLGPGSAGHYVKMVHNGIEYGLMELIAESYDLMKRGLSIGDPELQRIFDEWNHGDLNAFLIEITAHIFGMLDPETGQHLVDVILDEARQKGTGKWTSQDAMDLAVPVPTIDMAVAMRDLSGYKTEREKASRLLKGNSIQTAVVREHFIPRLKNAMYAGMLLTYAQGMAVLRMASKAYGYQLDLATVARIWRGGCIIRSALLEPIRSAFHAQPDLPNLLLNEELSGDLQNRIDDLRVVVSAGVQTGIPLPAFAASLAYYDGYRSAWLPANLIQAQRDYFGAHQYERTDRKGIFHTVWEKEQADGHS